MKKYTLLLAAVLALFTFAPAVAAPLFGDVPEEHWARDAVANLAAKGLVEGYPDGTFKGARAATRYELAMVVARLLAKNEQENATFATKADLEDLRRLVGQLKNELDALGVRVTNLEDSVSKLDKRVTELERITFYGELDSVFVTQGFKEYCDSRGAVYKPGMHEIGVMNGELYVPGENLNTSYHNWTGQVPHNGNFYSPLYVLHPVDPANAAVSAYNNTSIFRPGVNHVYNQLVGKIGGANITPFEQGVFPVADYRTGRPLTNGTGFSVRAVFGVNAKVSEDVDAGLELAAYSSVGDPAVNSYYGASAPYGSNPFTASNNGMGDIFGGGNRMMGYANAPGNSPWTKVTLDNFWIKHKPSGIKLVAGSFGELHMDPILYAGQPNPNVNGPKYLNNSGVRIFGSANLFSDVDWEVFYTNLADGDPYANTGVPFYQDASMAYLGTPYGSDYNTYAYGASLSWHFEGGNFKIGYLKAQNDTTADFNIPYSSNGIFSLGGDNFFLNHTAAPSSNPFGWVNPNGYFAGQLAGGDPSQAIPANTNWMNQSPIFTYMGGNALLANNNLIASDGSWGGYGAQETTNWSAHFDYMWDGPSPVRVMAEYAGSEWKPNKESDFSKSGSAFRGGLGITLFRNSVDIDAGYKSADAFFDPFTLRYPNGINSMWRFPQMSYFPDMYQLHDSDTYPNNREGWNVKLAYRFAEDRGRIWASYEDLEQKDSSLYDQRYYAGQVSGVNTANLIPNDLVFGYTPGFIEPVFTPYSMGTFYMWNAANPEVVSGWGTPLEDEKGKMTNWTVGAEYKIPNWDLSVEAIYSEQNFKRHSNLNINQIVNLGSGDWNIGTAASANHIDLDVKSLHVGLAYPFSEKFALKAGYDMTEFRGHYDPNNLYWLYASVSGSKDFVNVDVTQHVPYIGFDYKLSKNTEWGLNLQFFQTVDKIGASYMPVTDVSTENAAQTTYWSDSNPFCWDGMQLMTEFKVKF